MLYRLALRVSRAMLNQFPEGKFPFDVIILSASLFEWVKMRLGQDVSNRPTLNCLKMPE